MNRRENINRHIDAIAEEIFEHIKENQSKFPDRWMPAIEIKEELDLKRNTYPMGNKINQKGSWLFNIMARILEEKDKVEYKKEDGRAYYRVK